MRQYFPRLWHDSCPWHLWNKWANQQTVCMLSALGQMCIRYLESEVLLFNSGIRSILSRQCVSVATKQYAFVASCQDRLWTWSLLSSLLFLDQSPNDSCRLTSKKKKIKIWVDVQTSAVKCGLTTLIILRVWFWFSRSVFFSALVCDLLPRQLYHGSPKAHSQQRISVTALTSTAWRTLGLFGAFPTLVDHWSLCATFLGS